MASLIANDGHSLPLMATSLPLSFACSHSLPLMATLICMQAEWVEPYELIEVMECTIDAKELKEGKVKIPETTTRRAAEFMCDQLKVSSQKDVDNLHLAHEVVYNAGFYKGTMVSGEFAGLSVQEAKPKCKAALCASGQAFTYLEPEGLVTPRSTPDVECVVALVDQWYLKYGAHEWQAAVGKHLENLECFNPQVAKAFRDALAWLSDWACSRSFGLGTRIPWDEQVSSRSLPRECLVIASDGWHADGVGRAGGCL